MIAPEQYKTGTLYLVATPIGNLEDITLRALRVLREADLIACEDTRETQKLLSHFQIRTPTMSYHEHNEARKAPELIQALEEGKSIALVSDAGTPLISDPGFRLVALAIEQGVPVVPVPGASALLAALAASGLPAESFRFCGYLPSRRAARRKTLAGLASMDCALVFYETPHRLMEAVRDIQETLGDRRIVLARELTKLHEEFIRGRVSEVLEQLRGKPVRGEFTLLVAPDETRAQRLPAAGRPASEVPLGERVGEIAREQQVSKKEALKLAARERGITRREAYRLLHQEGKE
jgi:16S rRNA (cytidine1402-2'-O)-methyltransferase